MECYLVHSQPHVKSPTGVGPEFGRREAGVYSPELGVVIFGYEPVQNRIPQMVRRMRTRVVDRCPPLPPVSNLSRRASVSHTKPFGGGGVIEPVRFAVNAT
jgi:hypothetical protein